MIFGGKPKEVVERLLTYDTNTRNYSLRRTLGALAACGHADALPALLRLKDHSARVHASAEWSEALADIRTAEAAEALFSYLLEDRKSRGWHGDRNLLQAVASIAEATPALRKRILAVAAGGDQQGLNVVSEIVRHIRSEEFMTEVIASRRQRYTISEERSLMRCANLVSKTSR
jgi:uncharacterized protein YicC (UPF0701 family)